MTIIGQDGDLFFRYVKADGFSSAAETIGAVPGAHLWQFHRAAQTLENDSFMVVEDAPLYQKQPRDQIKVRSDPSQQVRNGVDAVL